MPSTESTEADSSTGTPSNEELAEQLERVVELTAKLTENQRALSARLDESDDTLEAPPAASLSDSNAGLESLPDYFR